MPNLCVISINVPDMEAALQFYCEKLGFEVSKVYDECIISLKHEGIPIILNKVERATTTQYPLEAQVVMGIQTLNLLETLAEYKELGIDIIYDTPLDCPPGKYSAIRDPFGNVIEILEFK
ncbi:VOC family protein [Paenibacillus marinisediminis]